MHTGSVNKVTAMLYYKLRVEGLYKKDQVCIYKITVLFKYYTERETNEKKMH